MDKNELKEARGRLEAFLGPLLPLFGRLERRKWGAFYVQGLLLEGGRKTAAGMAERFNGDEQALQQFVNQSPWDSTSLRIKLATIMADAAGERCAWILDDTGFPKKGDHSVGVARQYTGTLGKIGNCQIGASLNYATDDACFPLDFQLYLPKQWIEDTVKRKKAGIPEETTFKRKWQIGLEMIDRARAAGIPEGIVTADAGYGVVTDFRAELRSRQLYYVVGIQSEMSAWVNPVKPKKPSYQGQGRPRKRPRNLPTPKSALDIVKALPDDSWFDITWRQGTKGPLSGRFAAIRIQPSHGHTRGIVNEPMQWLLVEWPDSAPAPIKYWISNLPENTSLKDLVYWAKIRWWVEQNYQQLKDDIGLDHFEGRSFNGWHHHVTLTMIAFCFLVLEGLRCKKNFWVDSPTSKKGATESPFNSSWILSNMREKAISA